MAASKFNQEKAGSERQKAITNEKMMIKKTEIIFY
jgi:hypothetical protein